jgi:putative FmdB family regulatory protein
MPTYEYRCSACQHQFEIVQSIKDDALTTCPECCGSLRKVFGLPGIVLKGGGFYKTDNRSGGDSSSSSSSD